MNKTNKILILGSTGLVGSAILRALQNEGYTNILHPTRADLDLLRQDKVEAYFKTHKPDFVFLAAAKVGGILANNTYKADFIFENLTIQQNVFNAAFLQKTSHLLFLGSSCIYPKNCPQPIKEEFLLTSTLEPTNEPYAIAKIAGIKTAQAFRTQYGLNWISVMPTNLYGENDYFDPNNSHVIPGLITRIHQAILNNDAEFKIWGTGKARREFLYIDDLAKACLFIMKQKNAPDYINIGVGQDIEIAELAKIIAQKMGYCGKLIFDTSKPDGTMRKLLDVSRINELGWKAETDLSTGLDKTIAYFRKL